MKNDFFFLQSGTKTAREKQNTTNTLNNSKSRSASEDGDNVYLIELEGYYKHLPRNRPPESDSWQKVEEM